MAIASDADDASVGGSDLEEKQEVKETGGVEADGSDVAADEAEAAPRLLRPLRGC